MKGAFLRWKKNIQDLDQADGIKPLQIRKHYHKTARQYISRIMTIMLLLMAIIVSDAVVLVNHADAKSACLIFFLCLKPRPTPTPISDPTPTPQPVSTPIPTPTPPPVPTPIPSPKPILQPSPTVVPLPTRTPTPTASASPTATATPVPNPTPTSATPKVTFIGVPYTLHATEIDGENAHLQLLPDLLDPVLTFSSATIKGMNLSHPLTNSTSLSIVSSGPVTSTQVAIKTSTWQDLKASLGGHINPVDLITLTTGGTVKHLVLTNTTMDIDVYLKAQYLYIPNCQILITSA